MQNRPDPGPDATKKAGNGLIYGRKLHFGIETDTNAEITMFPGKCPGYKQKLH